MSVMVLTPLLNQIKILAARKIVLNEVVRWLGTKTPPDVREALTMEWSSLFIFGIKTWSLRLYFLFSNVNVFDFARQAQRSVFQLLDNMVLPGCQARLLADYAQDCR
jgi:hypothetical protein